MLKPPICNVDLVVLHVLGWKDEMQQMQLLCYTPSMEHMHMSHPTAKPGRNLHSQGHDPHSMKEQTLHSKSTNSKHDVKTLVA